MKTKPKKKLWKRIILTVLLVAIIGGALFWGYSAMKREYTVVYDSYTASIGSISNSLSFNGNFALIDSQSYTAGSDATVRAVPVKEGDLVKKGDTLMRLSNGETVKADFDGRVNTLSVDKDDEVKAGDALVQLADFDHLKVTLRIDEYDIGEVAVGQNCTITATATEKQFEGSITNIDYISSSTGNVAYYAATVKTDVSEGIYPGMQATVTIPKAEANNVVVLKNDALSFSRENRVFVYKMDSAGQLQEVYVETGVTNGNYVEIVSGVADGETVYVEAKKVDNSMTAMFASMFNTRQFNSNNRGNRTSGGMPSGMPSGGFQGGEKR